MKDTVVIFIIIVGVANIALNIFISKAATLHTSYFEAMKSTTFMIAFLIGTFSILSMLYLYYSKVDLGRAILLMGATSIIGGSLYGILFHGNKFDWAEIVILVFIGSLYSYRLFIKPYFS